MKRLFGLGSKPKQFEFRCSQCGEIHKGSPSFAFAKPTYYFGVPEDELEERVKISDDLCRIRSVSGRDDDETIYCIRTILDIPIHGAEEPFCWGVWVTQSRENFYRYVETLKEDQSDDGSFGWLAVMMPYYDTSRAGEPYEHLECDVAWGVQGQRPEIYLHESSHPLSVDQREGIAWEKAIEIAQQLLHRED